MQRVPSNPSPTRPSSRAARAPSRPETCVRARHLSGPAGQPFQASPGEFVDLCWAFELGWSRLWKAFLPRSPECSWRE